ncbi:glycoprotein integral membrane protein 1 [Microcaecilia unicolor]|uniref:Glycoprotein integral membrane protein 1 n=1 Tax=Microcaecilia unicolor TaxID=1415580 RepID=A0A6P7XMY2_9AMPH|nr:glycoprotein integral membrane protein 1 [Microcaecilia unicolor]
METVLWPPWSWFFLWLLPRLLFSSPLLADAALHPQESIRINVTSLKSTGDIREQVIFNISFFSGQVLVNDFPVKNGVTRVICPTIILESGSTIGRIQEVAVRILVHEWPLVLGSHIKLLVVQEEVMEIAGEKVQQEDTTEIEFLVNEEMHVLRYSSFSTSLKESMLYSISRDKDILFTVPNLSGKEVQAPLQTTSQYLLQQMETTVEEDTAPGKLPETPLRAASPSSYKVMCQWVEQLRKELCPFWLAFLPIYISIMEVVAIGVIGAATMVNLLKVVFPTCEIRNVLPIGDVYTVPDLIAPLCLEVSEKSVESAQVKLSTLNTKFLAK